MSWSDPHTPDRLAEIVKRLEGTGLTIGKTERVQKAETVADDTAKAFALDGAGRRRAVIQLASSGGPGLVRRGVENAALARQLLGEPLAGAILTPLAAGDIDGLSYAAWPYCEPLRIGGLRGRLRKFVVASEVVDWLGGVAEASRRAGGSESAAASAYGAALEAVRDSEIYAGSIRRQAGISLRRLRDGEWRPAHVLNHNDFWTGNLLGRAVEGARGRYRFTVIDWPGANMRGFGMYDAIRFARSMGMRARGVGRMIRILSRAHGGELGDTAGHLIASIGHLGQNLGCFQPERHARTAEECWRIYLSGLAAAGGGTRQEPAEAGATAIAGATGA